MHSILITIVITITISTIITTITTTTKLDPGRTVSPNVSTEQFLPFQTFSYRLFAANSTVSTSVPFSAPSMLVVSLCECFRSYVLEKKIFSTVQSFGNSRISTETCGGTSNRHPPMLCRCCCPLVSHGADTRMFLLPNSRRALYSQKKKEKSSCCCSLLTDDDQRSPNNRCSRMSDGHLQRPAGIVFCFVVHNGPL